MNPIEKLEKRVRREAPDAELRADIAKNPKGSSFLDIVRGDFDASVEFRPGHGFGISAPAGNSYGVGPDEVIADESEAIDRVLSLLKTNEKTVPQREISLKRLREIRRMTQEELAKRLDVKQASVSKLEQRDELYVSTFRRVVAALGGKLELVTRVADGSLTLDVSDTEQEPRAATKPAR